MIKYHYELVDFFDETTENVQLRTFPKKLHNDQMLEMDDVTYRVEECDYWKDKKLGRAIVRMVRYRIDDTATQVTHKCPAKKKAMESLDSDDVIKIEHKYGKKGATKRIKQWKAGRAKMNTHNKLYFEK